MNIDNDNFLEDEFSFDEINTKKNNSPKKINTKKSIPPFWENEHIKNFSLDFLKNKKVVRIFILIGIILALIIVFMVFKKFINTTVNVDTPAQNTPSTNEQTSNTNTTETSIKLNSKQFENLRFKYGNNNIKAYINIMGTLINSPVVQTNNNTYYQDHDAYDQNNINGTIFADATSNLDNFDKNTVIYGRTDLVGVQLFDLSYYESEEFYRKNKFINLNTENENSVWEIYSFYSNIEDNFYLKTSFEDEDFLTFIVSTNNLSKYENDITLTKDDKILTLTSTNSSGIKYVLHAKYIN